MRTLRLSLLLVPFIGWGCSAEPIEHPLESKSGKQHERKGEMIDFAFAYRKFAIETGRGPSDVNDLAQRDRFKNLSSEIKNGEFVVIWNGTLPRGAAKGSCVLGFERAVETGQGLVVLDDGEIVELTREEFQRYSRIPVVPPGPFVQVNPRSGSADAVLRSEIAKARQENRVPYVYLAADWCPPCVAIKRTREDPRMKSAFEGTRIIEFDTSIWRKLPLNLKASVLPSFYEVGYDGKLTGRLITGAAWGENTPQNMAPPLKKFFSESKVPQSK